LQAEKDFKAKKIKSILCTSSLQLGLDIGHVDAVIQYRSPRTITQLIQRTGRSGHALHKVSKGTIITTDEDDIFESAVIARKALVGELEPLRFHHNSLDVLAHQLIGLSMEYGRVDLRRAYHIIASAWPYHDLSYVEFLEVCKQLERLGLAWLNGTLRRKRRGVQYYFEQLSTIPTVRQYKIVNVVDNSVVGVLDEEFVVLHAQPGTTFIVKGEAWKILDVTENSVVVEPTVDITAAVPGWEGELIPVPYEVAQEVGKLRSFIREHLNQGKELVTELQQLYPIDVKCARKMIKLIERQLKESIVPDHRTLLLEWNKDIVVLHACCGSLVNEALGRLLSALLSARVGSVALRTDPYRIMLRWPGASTELVREVLYNTKPELAKSYLEISLTKSPLFEWKFLQVAKRFGAISKDVRTPFPLKMRRVMEEFVGTPLFKETLNEVETEKLDVEKAIEVLKGIQSGKLKLVLRKGLSPLSELGLIYRYGEIVPPPKPEKEILRVFKQRLLRAKFKLICLNCGKWYGVFSVGDLPSKIKCKCCDAKLLAVTRADDEEAWKTVTKKSKGAKLNMEEEHRYKKLQRTAQLFLSYESQFIKCLAVPGVGPETAVRILARYHETEEDLLKDLLEAEKRWFRTRRFWSI
jgi:ATP-dependent Lhr-like helicase